MSRYLAFVLLALSATSVLAAPAEIPPLPTVPSLETVTRPVLGSRSNKVYSPHTLHKRDSEYPASTKDCALSEDSKDPSYTHDGLKYSEDCLTRLALSVPSENRKSCRTTGAGARGYDEECLFKKAFDEDWKFDLEKAKEDELAWRAENPSHSSSEAWHLHFPIAIIDCIKVDVDVEVDGEKEKGKGKDVTKTSDGWSPHSVTSTGETVDNDCILRLVIRAKIVIDLGTCKADKTIKPHSVSDVAAPVQDHGLPHLFGRSSAELATREIDVALNILAALRLGCLIEIVEEIIKLLGLKTILLTDPLEVIVKLLASLLKTLG